MWVEGASLYHCRRLSSVFGQFDRTFEWKLLNLGNLPIVVLNSWLNVAEVQSGVDTEIICMSSSRIGVGRRSAWGCKRKKCCILSRDNVSATPLCTPATCSIWMDMSNIPQRTIRYAISASLKAPLPSPFDSSYYSSVVTFEQNRPARQKKAPNSATYNNWDQLFCHDCLLGPF